MDGDGDFKELVNDLRSVTQMTSSTLQSLVSIASMVTKDHKQNVQIQPNFLEVKKKCDIVPKAIEDAVYKYDAIKESISQQKADGHAVDQSFDSFESAVLLNKFHFEF
ncbi:hypothetical protein ACOME3_006119 [Neoechinorhynchus agilis]